ncbi:DUF3810 domain-containing protein [Urechidicola croceus]|uniref:Amino acid permease n=1 Tax=Urechidicola croceus TaxID=1850246 RepID=A0A1D8P551_9FLAO|nr:DUF3810 domain-containing protein [Urechidicola croceus]AOW19713.1 hypothetical protein LPB138_03020 [Urechidicola croceus]
MKNKKNDIFFAIFLIFQLVFVQVISKFPSIIEKYYSQGIYKYISNFFRILVGWIPFSIGDLLYIIFIIYIVHTIIKNIKSKKINLIKLISRVSIIYFCFHFFWGFNYLREPLSQTMKINDLEYTTEDLEFFTNQLIEKTNNLHHKITNNDTIKVELPYSKKEIYTMVSNGYQKLSDSYPQFEYKNKSIKHSIISLPLTYMGFSGYLNPFTGEAQVNSLNPVVSFPSTSCHEVGHQIGYAAENEANFVGFLAAVSNNDVYFKYSGYFMALRYTLNDLYRHDKDKYNIALKNINKGILKNMQESKDFWQSYQNPFEVYFKSIFNSFLKVNKQPEGIKSYSKMVGMLINYNKTENNILQFNN